MTSAVPMTKDYYQTLNVPKNADVDAIKKEYKKLARRFHPDVPGGDEEKFKEINEAYEVLSDTDKRSNYDRFGDPNGRPGFGSGPDPFGDSGFGGFGGFGRSGSNIDEILEQMSRLRRAREQEARDPFFRSESTRDRFSDTFKTPSKDINIDYQITMQEAFDGKRVKATVNVPGRGRKQLDLVIPAGIEHGKKIRFAGEGAKAYANSVPGDIYITIKIQPDPRFRRQAQTLYMPISVNAIDAMLGCRIQVKGIDGKMLSVNIPQGTQQGDQLRCRGHGFSIQGMVNRGDLIVEANIIIPKTLRPEEEALLRQLKKLKDETR